MQKTNLGNLKIKKKNLGDFLKKKFLSKTFIDESFVKIKLSPTKNQLDKNNGYFSKKDYIFKNKPKNTKFLLVEIKGFCNLANSTCKSFRGRFDTAKK